MTPHHHHHRHAHGRGIGAVATARLRVALVLTLVYTAAEVAGGILSNSLSLLADASHMMMDNLALGLALLAARFARRPPDPGRTYGYQRAEMLAALANGVALVVICLFIVWEAWGRLRTPPEVEYGLMAAVATGGLLVNLAGVLLLRGARDNLNVGAAYMHVLGDLLGSVGTLAAAALIGLAGWRWADPLASILIAGIIIVGSVRLVLVSVNVLMEGAPAHLDTQQVRQCLLDTAGVAEIHDLHLWSLAGGAPLLSAHLVVDHTVSSERVLREATRALEERFAITHTTLQLEPPDYNIVRGILENPSERPPPNPPGEAQPVDKSKLST